MPSSATRPRGAAGPSSRRSADRKALRRSTARSGSGSTRTQPLAVGEVFNSIYDTHTLITEQLIDYAPRHLDPCGRRRPASRQHLRFRRRSITVTNSACHGPQDVSPVAMGCNIHVDVAIPNFGIQEFAGLHRSRCTRCSTAPGPMTAATCSRARSPGHGVDIDEEWRATCRSYPYGSASLPAGRPARRRHPDQLVSTNEDHRHQALPGLGRHPQPAHRQGRDRRRHLRLGRERACRAARRRSSARSSTIASSSIGRDPMQHRRALAGDVSQPVFRGRARAARRRSRRSTSRSTTSRARRSACRSTAARRQAARPSSRPSPRPRARAAAR